MKGQAIYEGDVELHYATARFACQWLDDDRGTLWRFYRAWRQHLPAKLPEGWTSAQRRRRSS
jgi:hypothetical protein